MLRFIAALALVASPAFAQTPACAPTQDVIAALTGGYGEVIIATGQSPQGMIEWWASPSGSWTMALNLGGTTCLLASGQDYRTGPAGEDA